MGEVIRKNAAVADILADVVTTLHNARERGGDWQKLAEERLSPLLALADDVSAKLNATRAKLAPLEAALEAVDESADRLLRRIGDDVWNAVGRPFSDPSLDILFPDGADYYADGALEQQPERMELLAELLSSGIHPRLAADKAQAFAAEVREAAGAVRAKLEAAAPERARVALLARVQMALARTGQVQLSHLKRLYRAQGMSEAEVHRVIPDRPRRLTKAPAQEPGQAPSGT